MRLRYGRRRSARTLRRRLFYILGTELARCQLVLITRPSSQRTALTMRGQKDLRAEDAATSSIAVKQREKLAEVLSDAFKISISKGISLI